MENKCLQTQGFTLLEVIIAMAIMVVSFATILSVESNSINANIRAKSVGIVATLARNKMIDMEYQIEGKAFDEINKEQSGDFQPPYESYRWKAEIKEVKFPNLSQAPKTPGGGTDSGEGSGDLTNMVTKLITNFLSKAVREVTVTIYWKKAEGEQPFSVSTYWVDLNHEFALSE